MIQAEQKATWADLEEVREVHAPRGPKSYWRPVAHEALAKAVIGLLREFRLKPGEPEFALAPRGLAMAGFVEVGPGAVGFMHANDGRMGLSIYGGFRHKDGWVIPWAQRVGKHSTARGGDLDLRGKLLPAVSDFVGWLKTVPALKRALRQVEVSKGQANDLLVDAGKKKLIPWERVGPVLVEFERSGGESAADLLACFWTAGASKAPVASRSTRCQMPAAYEFCRRSIRAESIPTEGGHEEERG